MLLPTDSNEESKKILADILGKDSEESIIPKKEIKNPFKDKKNDDYNDYEFSDDKELGDDDW